MTRPHMELTYAPIAQPSRRPQMLLKQAGVLPIGLPGKVEGIADERDGTQQEVHTDIGEHPPKQDG
jgi:hypothetical protein